eukprot:scaffold65049_cov32-Tisochrysis_lutea.AAC.2
MRNAASRAPNAMRRSLASRTESSRRHSQPVVAIAARSMPRSRAAESEGGRAPTAEARRPVAEKYVAIPAAPNRTGQAKSRTFANGASTSSRRRSDELYSRARGVRARGGQEVRATPEPSALGSAV